MRMFTAVPMHAAFAVIMGYYIGLSKYYHGSARTEKSLKGLFYAVVLHGAYDFLLFQDDMPILSFLIFPVDHMGNFTMPKSDEKTLWMFRLSIRIKGKC